MALKDRKTVTLRSRCQSSRVRTRTVLLGDAQHRFFIFQFLTKSEIIGIGGVGGPWGLKRNFKAPHFLDALQAPRGHPDTQTRRIPIRSKTEKTTNCC
jgi:hypothetical protein